MARTNISVLPDVSVCLRDAMDAMFNNGHHTAPKINGFTVMTPEDKDIIVDVVNDDVSLMDSSLLSMNKRKLTESTDNNQEELICDTDNTKRLCTSNGSCK